MVNKVGGIKRIFNAWKYSMLGFRAAWINEAAFRQEVFMFLILAPLGLWLGETGMEKALLLAAVVLVLVVELVNSAIEAVVDRFGEDWDVLSGRAKDMGSAAVFLSLANMVMVWLLVLM